jgi:tryptophanyl-tRNA synthetase
MWIAGNEEKMEDISHCFMYFDQFLKDFQVLFDEGVIRRIAFDHYEWTKSTTSLAEYFKWIGNDAGYVPGGFWAPVEEVFRINRRKLSKLAGNNANPLKPKESKNFKEIKKMVEEYRKKVKQQAEQEREDRKTFTTIKTIIDKTDDKDIKEISAALEKLRKSKLL